VGRLRLRSVSSVKMKGQHGAKRIREPKSLNRLYELGYFIRIDMISVRSKKVVQIVYWPPGHRGHVVDVFRKF
jgi:hypothetical protein